MEEKFDIIAVMNSGVPCAGQTLQEKLHNGNSDIRLLSFFPVRVTPKHYNDFLTNHNNKWLADVERTEEKFISFQKNKQKYLQNYLADLNSITEDEIRKLKAEAVFPHTYDTAKQTVIENKWTHYMNIMETKEPQFPNITLAEFILNPEVRLSDKPDPSRTAILCDDYIYGKTTMIHSIFDLFRLGYTKVEFISTDSDSGKHFFDGNYEEYKANYKGKEQEIEFIRNIFK